MMLSSSWTASDGFNLNDGVEVCSEVPSLLQDLLLENKSFVLIPDAQCWSLPCSLTFQGPPCTSSKNVVPDHVRVISSITLVSESRLVEVFVGDHEEYLESFSGQVIQSFPDSIVCKTDIHLPKPKKKVKLLLKNLFDPGSVMVYGIFVKVEELGPESLNCSSFSRFSSSHLNSLLADRSLNLSESAQALKRMVEQYNDNVDNNAAASIGNLMPFLSMSIAHARTPKKSVSQTGAVGGIDMDKQNIGHSEGCENASAPLRGDVNKGNKIVKPNVTDCEVLNGNSLCEKSNDLLCHKRQQNSTNVEALSSALKNQLNLNLSSSLSPESAQLLDLFLKENKSKFSDCLLRNESSELNSGEQNLSSQADKTSLVVAAPSHFVATETTAFNGQTCDAEGDSTHSLTMKATKMINGHSHEKDCAPCPHSLSKLGSPENAATPPCVLPHFIKSQSGCVCHQLEKIMDEKLEKFEARIEMLINRKLDECVTKMLHVLPLSSTEKLSLGCV